MVKIFDETDIFINTFWSHSSIVKLKQKMSFKRNFTFKLVTEKLLKTSLI